MFWLHILPEWVLTPFIYSLLFLGIVGTLISTIMPTKLLMHVPTIAPYVKAIQIGSTVTLLLSIFLFGSYKTEVYWREKLKEVTAQLEEAQKQSAKQNVIIKDRIIQKTRIIHDKTSTISNSIQNSTTISDFDKKCELPADIIELHNEAAK